MQLATTCSAQNVSVRRELLNEILISSSHKMACRFISVGLVLLVAVASFGLAEQVEQQSPLVLPTFKQLMLKYGAQKQSMLRSNGLVSTDASTSFLQVAAGTGVKAAGGCEVCVYVVENKQMHQPFLCRGLKDPAYQQTCVSALISMMWWLENQVYWVNYGCQRKGTNDQWEWVKPCPAHAVCSWMQNLYDREPFCPLDPKYQKPGR
jgi:hypothetical protein